MEVLNKQYISMKQLKFSVVVPVYNEEDNISLLDKEIRKTMNSLDSS